MYSCIGNIYCPVRGIWATCDYYQEFRKLANKLLYVDSVINVLEFESFHAFLGSTSPEWR
jgi:hypothetical protein